MPPFGRAAFSSFLLLLTSLLFAPSSAFAARALHPLCREHLISELLFSGVRAIPETRDFCASTQAMPAPVAALVKTIGEQNRAVVRTLGMSAEDLLGDGVRLLFSAYSAGSIRSYVYLSGSQIHLAVFPDWDLGMLSKKVYAHELVHFMIFRGTPLTEALAGLEKHPFIEEAFPDLVALVANRDPVMTFDDAGLPSCLRIQRDGTPLRSLTLPQRSFHFLSGTEALVACCKSLREEEKTPGVRAICAEDHLDPDLYETIAKLGVEIHPPTEAELDRPFDPKACVRRVKGISTLDNCNSRQFSKVLVSFFFSLEKKLGQSLLPLFVNTLAEDGKTRPTRTCGYTARQSTQKASVRIGSVSKALLKMRERLASDGEKNVFDQTWDEHALEKLVELDRIYSSENLTAVALPLLARLNVDFQTLNGCGATYTAKPACALKCL